MLYTFEKSELSTINGIGVIEYSYNADHEIIAQHNYPFCLKPIEISFRGWYGIEVMNTCPSIVAVWRIKQLH
jgi:hypothetical protein